MDQIAHITSNTNPPAPARVRPITKRKHQVSNQQPDPNHSSSSLFNTVLEIIIIANQALLSTCCIIASTCHQSISCPPNHLLYQSAPHPKIGQRPWPTVDAGWTSDSFAITAHAQHADLISSPPSNDRCHQQLMPDGVIVALTAPPFGAHTQHTLIVCVVISAVAIILTSLPQP
eukprot:scaffold318947_cov68-Attheya_sp.AAC.1